MQPCEVGKSYRWPFSSHDLQKAVFVTQSHKRIQFHLAQLVNQAWICFEVICLPLTKVHPPFGRLVLELFPSASKSRKSKIHKRNPYDRCLFESCNELGTITCLGYFSWGLHQQKAPQPSIWSSQINSNEASRSHNFHLRHESWHTFHKNHVPNQHHMQSP